MKLEDKVILITGASSGLGRATAIAAANEGARVVMVARDVNRLNETSGLLTGEGHLTYSANLGNYAEIESLIDDVVEKCGKISGFVHCAGIEKTIPFRSTKASIYEELFSINVIAGFELARVISKKKNLNNNASFVFVSSVRGILGKVGNVAYCASKSALISSIKAMALELAPKNVRCNTILPGIIETEMVENMFKELPEFKNEVEVEHPLGIGEPIDVANLCLFLLSDDAKWITGSEIVIDGGYSCK